MLFQSLSLCAVIESGKRPDKNGKTPLILLPIAGILPTHFVNGTIAENMGVLAGHTYLLRCREAGFHTQHGVQYNWLNMYEVTNPADVLYLQEGLRNVEILASGGKINKSNKPGSQLQCFECIVSRNYCVGKHGEVLDHEKDCTICLEKIRLWHFPYSLKFETAAQYQREYDENFRRTAYGWGLPESDWDEVQREMRRVMEYDDPDPAEWWQDYNEVGKRFITSSMQPLRSSGVFQDMVLLEYWKQKLAEVMQLLEVETWNPNSVYSLNQSLSEKVIRIANGITWRIEQYGKAWGMNNMQIKEFIDSISVTPTRTPLSQ